MNIDIVFPENNELRFVEIAKKLDYGGLCLVYSLNNFNKNKMEMKDEELKLLIGILARAEEINKAKKLSKYVFVKSSDKDRLVIEKNKDIVLFGMESMAKRDFIHHRAGLNQVLCKLANKNNVKIGFSFSDILMNDGVDRANILGRMMHNIRLCRKYKIKTIIASFSSEPFCMRSVHDLAALGTVLGMDKSSWLV